jgi:hypothetical protein
MGKPRSILPNGCLVPRPAQHDPIGAGGRRFGLPARPRKVACPTIQPTRGLLIARPGGAPVRALALPVLTSGPACPFGPNCSGAIAARTMIMVIPHLISCGITMKSEIMLDRAAARGRALCPSPRTALTLTTRHFAALSAYSQGRRDAAPSRPDLDRERHRGDHGQRLVALAQRVPAGHDGGHFRGEELDEARVPRHPAPGR